MWRPTALLCAVAAICSSGIGPIAATAGARTPPSSGPPARRSPPDLTPRASIHDHAPAGYASLQGGTTGGSGGTVIRVSTLPELVAAAGERNKQPTVVVVMGMISGAGTVRLGSAKTIVGGVAGAGLTGVALAARGQANIIIRNLVSAKVRAGNGDGLTIQQSSNVWVDHCEFYSDRDHDKDYYDGLVDVTHGSDYVTISNTFFHDHWKASLVGHSDRNGKEDKGHLRVTYHSNRWLNIGSRTPSLRFGTGHVFDSFFENMTTGIDAREGAQLLVENNVFRDVGKPIASLYSTSQGFVTDRSNDLGGANDTAPSGNLTAAAMPYKYTLLPLDQVEESVKANGGATLTFDDI